MCKREKVSCKRPKRKRLIRQSTKIDKTKNYQPILNHTKPKKIHPNRILSKKLLWIVIGVFCWWILGFVYLQWLGKYVEIISPVIHNLFYEPTFWFALFAYIWLLYELIEKHKRDEEI